MVDKILSSDVNIKLKNKIDTNSNQQKSNQNLYSAIDRLFKTPQKNANAKNLYSWILLNVKDFEALENGNVITPLKNINIFDFMKDIFSKTSKFTSEKLNIYKIFVSIIDLPSNFIENKSIREYLFPNIDKPSTSFVIPKFSPNKKRKYMHSTDSDSQLSNSDDDVIMPSTSTITTPTRAKTKNLERYVDRKSNEYPITRSKKKKFVNKKLTITASGSNSNTNLKKKCFKMD